MRKYVVASLVATVILITIFSMSGSSNLQIQSSITQNTISVSDGVEEIIIPLNDGAIKTTNINSNDDVNIEFKLTGQETGESYSQTYNYDVPSDGEVNLQQSVQISGFDSTDFPADQSTDLELEIIANHPDVSKKVSTSKISIVRNTDRTSCQTIKQTSSDASSGVYTIEPTDGNAFDVYCDMSTEGGGWTLVATYADDGNNYWTSNNRGNIINGNTYGTLETALTQDFQSKAYTDLKGDQILIRDGEDNSQYLRYDGVLSDQTLESKYVGGENVVGDFSVDVQSGSWDDTSCNTLDMRLQTPDTDGEGWSGDNGAYGFIWHSNNNNGCPYDDYAGNVYGDDEAWGKNSENTWNRGFFYQDNFEGSSMTVFIR